MTPTLSVEAPHERSTRLELTAVALRLVGAVGRRIPYCVFVPLVLISPALFPVKSFEATNVRLQRGLLMLSPYACVFVGCVSVARLFLTTLSSHVTESPALMWIPS